MGEMPHARSRLARLRHVRIRSQPRNRLLRRGLRVFIMWPTSCGYVQAAFKQGEVMCMSMPNVALHEAVAQ